MGESGRDTIAQAIKSEIRNTFVSSLGGLVESGDVKVRERRGQAYDLMLHFYMTIVDAYVSGGHFDKAMGVLKKIKEDGDTLKESIIKSSDGV